jgi:SAM-dependent methyltransferase
MDEQSKAAKRRFNDGAFQTRYFVGEGLDVGAGNDGLDRHARFFPLITRVDSWDVGDGDAQYLQGAGHYDFLHSSHCLEHMTDPAVALQHWVNVVNRGGHLIITVPDEDMYERGFWPSRFNGDHKWTFTVHKPDGESWSPRSINLLDLLREMHNVRVERIAVIRDFFNEATVGDQTLQPNVESSIEFVLRRV